MKRLMAGAIPAMLLFAVWLPTSEAAEPPYGEPGVMPEVEPKRGDACCERTWCIEREGTCEKTCDHDFKMGSRKWTGCRDYCNKEVHRCGTCCTTHHAPDCNLYCWGR